MLQPVQVETQPEQQGLKHLHPKRATGGSSRELTLHGREQCFDQGTAPVDPARKRPPHFGPHASHTPRFLSALGRDHAAGRKTRESNPTQTSPPRESARLGQINYVSERASGSQVEAGTHTFVPALQCQDGSYIETGYNNLIALGLDGSVVWQQPIGVPVTPLYATADGGVIATSTPPCSQEVPEVPYGRPPCPLGTPPTSLGTLYTVDKNGNVTSQAPDTGAVYSWAGQWYDPPPAGGMVSALALFLLDWGYGPAAFQSGNPSGTLVWTDRCPALDSASKGLMESASSALNSFLAYPCSFCVNSILWPLDIKSQKDFTTYLGQGHRFCDGTKSKEPAATVNPAAARNTTVADYFTTHGDVEVATVHGKSSPLWTFFRPNKISRRDPYYNESTVFHEALHGKTGMGDGTFSQIGLCQLLTVFGSNNLPVSGLEKEYPNCTIETKDITYWIEENVFGQQPNQ